MKILYLAHDRAAAESASVALRSLAHDVAMAWAESAAAASEWITANRDLAAILVDVSADDVEYAAFVSESRGLGVVAPAIVLSSLPAGETLPALQAVADRVVAKSDAARAGLAAVVRAAFREPRSAGRRPLRIQYVGDAALARECFGKAAAEVVETGAGADGTRNPISRDLRAGAPLPFDVLLIEHGYPGVETFAILRELAARGLHVPVVIVAEWIEDLAVLTFKLGATDYVVKSKAAFRSLLFRINRLLASATVKTLEAKLSEAEAYAAGLAQVIETRDARLAEREAELEAERDRLSVSQQHADRDLSAAEAIARDADERTASAMAGQAALRELLVAAELELEQAAARHAAERREAGAQLAQIRTHAEARSAEALMESARRQAIEERLREVEAAGADGEHLHVAALREAAAQVEARDRHAQALQREADAERVRTAVHLAQAEAQAEVRIAETVAAHAAILSELADATTALARADEQRRAADEARAQAEQRHAAALSDAGALRAHAAEVHAAELREAAARLEARDQHAETLQREMSAERLRSAAMRQALEGELQEARAATERAGHDHAAALREAALQLEARDQRLDALQQETDAERLRAAATQQALEGELQEARAAIERAGHDHAAALREAALQLEARDQRLDGLQRETGAERLRSAALQQALEGELHEARAAIERAGRDHAAAMNDAVARLIDSQKQSDVRLEDARAAHEATASQLAEMTAARDHADAQAAIERQAAAERAALLQAEADGELAAETVRRQTLQEHVRQLETARQLADRQHAAAMSDAAARLAEQEAGAAARMAAASAAHDTTLRQLADATAAYATVQAQLTEAVAAIERADHAAVAAREAWRSDAAQREASADAERAAHAARERGLDAERAAVESALAHAHELHAVAMRDAAERLSEQDAAAEARLEAANAAQAATSRQLADALAAHESVSDQLAEMTGALDRAQAAAALERQAAHERFAQEQAGAAAARDAAAARQAALEQHLGDAEVARQRIEAAHALAIREAEGRLAAHETLANGLIAEAVSAHQATSTRLADATAALQDAEYRHGAAMASAAAELTDHRARSESQLAQAGSTIEALKSRLTVDTAERHRLEQQLADAETARERAERDHASALAAEAARFIEAEERAAARLVFAMATAEAIEQQLAALQRQLATTEADALAARQAAAAEAVEQETAFAAERQRAAEAIETLSRQLADALDARARADQQHAVALADSAARLTELQARSDAALARAAEEIEAARRTARDQIVATEGAAARQVAERQAAFELAMKDAAAQRHGVERVLTGARATLAETERRLTQTLADHDRQFAESPVNLCRCSRDGVTQVNHALAAWLGYDSTEELTRAGFAATVFESADDLDWIVERCLTARTTDPIETTWRKKDGSRVLVRLLARPILPDAVELVAEDLTAVRSLEERLRHAQRLEAVARYASEVAVTCGTVLGDAQAEAQRWLATIESDTVRYRGELLLNEVTRATGLVQQLAECGSEQMNATVLVDVNKVLRDLAPVLKRVAGGHVEIALPKASAPLNLDVEAARVERILINVAAFGRQRMPLGGRLMIEVDAVVLDRQFVAKYPSVRSGAHVLLTVTEMRSERRAELVTDEAPAVPGLSSARPGVDLGALQGLVSDVGGHLWMTAEPAGHMVLKMHLPRRALDRSAVETLPKPSLRARWAQRLSGARR